MYNGSFIFFSKLQTNYHTAARICRLRGLQLASIPSRADDDAILNMIIKKGNQKRPIIGLKIIMIVISSRLASIYDEGWGNKQFWIGASNQGENNTKEYYWNHNGRYLKQGYENWASNQPDNNGDDCFAVQINYNKQWDDHKCATELGFVCESLISSV